MNTEIITIYCRDYSFLFLFLADLDAREILKHSGYKVEFWKKIESVIDLTIDGKNVRLIISGGWMNHCDVCIVGWFVSVAGHNIDEIKRQVSKCKQYHAEAPIIVVEDATMKNSSQHLKLIERAGQKAMNRKIGDELVRDIGAVKYVEYSRKSGRGLKIIIDEIVFAYFSKQKVEEDRERIKKEVDQIRRERTKRNVFMIEKFLDVLHYI